jgi:hypothetical protein
VTRPERSRSIFSTLMSAQTTECPSEARQALVVNPT